MSAVTAAASHESAAQRLAINRLGLWLFFFSDALLFGLLATARFYINGTHTPEHLSQGLGLTLTSILLVSSYTAYRAETAFAHGALAHGRQMLLLTIVLGAIFVGGVGVEWAIADFTPSEGYGTAFFSMTGMHALHVISGLLFLGLLWMQVTRRGEVGSWAPAAIVMYWHFVDVVWVFFYPTLYLVS
jgi:cytochrome c oxidase subunit 3